MNSPNHLQTRLEDLDHLMAQRARELHDANEKLKKEMAERARAEKFLRLAEERFSKAFQASPIPLAIQSLLNEKFVDANAGFLSLVGYEHDELAGQTARKLGIWDEPEKERAMLDQLGREMSVRDLSCRFRTKNGRKVDVLLSVELIELDGQPFVLAIAQDVTEQIKLENQLRQAQRLEAVGQLAAGVAHDFNNILAIVQGNASILLANTPENSPDRRPLQSICTAADQAAKLVGQLLSFCHEQSASLRPTEMHHVLDDVGDKLSRVLTPKTKLEINILPGLPRVSADAGMVETMLMNLAANAREAMPEGGCLSITAEKVAIGESDFLSHPKGRPGEFVRLSVQDTGVGISAEILPRIFEPFFTTKAEGEGAGLGLAAVNGIVKQHHGWLEVQSKVKQGTTFHVFLPVWAEEAQPQNQTAALPARREPNAARETVLVVDDEPDLRELISQILESDGYHVLLAASGTEALEQWAKHGRNIHLLLTDMMMPDGLTGRILADRLQSEDPRLRVIYTSGYTAGQGNGELAQIEDRHFLAKPYRPNTLLRVVRECLDHPGGPASHAQKAA